MAVIAPRFAFGRSTAAWEDWLDADVRRQGDPPPLKLTSITATPASFGPIGAPVTWTAQANDDVAPLEYRIFLRDESAGTWTLLKDYDTASSATWTPAAAGSYYAQAWVRSAGSTAAWEDWLDSSTFVAVMAPVVPPPAAVTKVFVLPENAVPQIPAVSVSPATVSLAPGAAQRFTAVVTGTPNQHVTWSATGGTVASDGTYTAGPRPGRLSSQARSRWYAVSSAAPVAVTDRRLPRPT